MKTYKGIVFDGLFAVLVIVGLNTCDQKMNSKNLVAMEDQKILRGLSDR